MLLRWLGVYIDSVSNIIILATSLFAVIEKDNISAGTAALSISYASTVRFNFNS